MTHTEAWILEELKTMKAALLKTGTALHKNKGTLEPGVRYGHERNLCLVRNMIRVLKELEDEQG